LLRFSKMSTINDTRTKNTDTNKNIIENSLKI
jgi:hypothetical protein